MRLPWWVSGLTGLGGFLLCVYWPFSPAVAPVTQVITDTVYQQLVPDTIIRWSERVVWKTIPAETIQVTKVRHDTTRVKEFCAHAAQPDSTAPILPNFGGRFNGRSLELYATRSDGSGFRQVQAARAPFQFAARTQDVLVQDRRHLPQWVGTTLKLGACAGLGVGVQRLTSRTDLGAAAGGGCTAGLLLP